MLRGFITLAAVCALALPTSAQDLDGVWFKLRVKSKGASVANSAPAIGAEGEPGETVSKASFKTTAWMLLTFDDDEGGSGNAYNAIVITEVDDDLYDISDTPRFNVFGDRLLTGGFTGFVTPDGAVGADCTLEAKVKLDKEGAFKSAKLKALGANVSDSALFLEIGGGEGGVLPYFGGMTIKGSSLPVEKLPFDPEEVLKGGVMLAKQMAPGVPWVFGNDAAAGKTPER